MAELIKQWPDGSNLSIAYNGSGSDNVIFSSDENRGDERETEVTFVDVARNVFIVRKVKQAAGQTSIETYTRLTYIECTAKQYFDSGYVVNEGDTIEAYFDSAVESADKFLYYTTSSQGSVWLSIYGTSAYVRFGQTASKTVSSAAIAHYIKAKKESVTFDVTATALDFAGMPTATLKLFGAINSSGLYNGYKGKCTMFKITDSDGSVVMELSPVKRDSDGKVGLLDLVSGNFFISEYDDFIGGNEIRITEDYEIIERIYFNKDRAFDTGFYGNETISIDVMFQRTATNAAVYLFGCSNGNRLTAYLSSGSGYWRYGSAYPTFATASLKIYKGVVTPGKTTVDNSSKTFSFSAFDTSWTLPLGGHKGSTNTITKTYIGYIYYFRMWHGNELLLDWNPCRRKSDGMEGFWDCVSQKFVEPL